MAQPRTSGPSVQQIMDPVGLFAGSRHYDSQKLGQSEVRDSALRRYGNNLGAQQGALERLNARASGTGGPSLAEQQMQSGLAQVNQQVMGATAGARGINRTDAQLNAQRDLAKTGAQVGRDMGALRAQEQMQAEQAYAQGLAGLQSQEMGMQSLGQADQLAMLNAEAQNRQLNEKMASEQKGLIGNVLGTVGGALGALSDIRAKEDIRPAPQAHIGMAQIEPQAHIGMAQLEPRVEIGQAEIDALPPEYQAMATPQGSREALGDVEPYSYRYKPEAAMSMATDTDPRLGVMAQDLEKTSMSPLVEDTPEGKAIDGPKAVSALMALVAAQEKRLEKLEGGDG